MLHKIFSGSSQASSGIASRRIDFSQQSQNIREASQPKPNYNGAVTRKDY
jgi:hypothetical protein